MVKGPEDDSLAMTHAYENLSDPLSGHAKVLQFSDSPEGIFVPG